MGIIWYHGHWWNDQFIVVLLIVLFDFVFLSSFHWNDEDLVRSCLIWRCTKLWNSGEDLMLKSGLPKLMKTVTLEDIQKQSKTCLVILLDINSMIMEHPPCGFDDVTVKSKRGSTAIVQRTCIWQVCAHIMTPASIVLVMCMYVKHVYIYIVLICSRIKLLVDNLITWLTRYLLLKHQLKSISTNFSEDHCPIIVHFFWQS